MPLDTGLELAALWAESAPSSARAAATGQPSPRATASTYSTHGSPRKTAFLVSARRMPTRSRSRIEAVFRASVIPTHTIGRAALEDQPDGLAYSRGAHAAPVCVTRQREADLRVASLRPDLVVNLSSLATYRQFVTDPERLERELLGAPASVQTVLIDEVQRVPALLDGVQATIDRHPRRFRFPAGT
jgi:hypothetical protein